MEKYTIRTSTLDDAKQLHQIWKNSVEATHSFVSAEHIEEMSNSVMEYLRNAKIEVVVNRDNQILGFMGMDAQQIDTLFVDPKFFKKGVGHTLMMHAKSKFSSLTVDVNEQNLGARAFYEKYGFVISSRSEKDSDGRPYPILHLVLEQ